MDSEKYFLHSVVIMKILEHNARSSSSDGNSSLRTGFLLGNFSGKYEVSDAFEAVYSQAENGACELNIDFFRRQYNLVKQTSSDNELIGFYICSEKLDSFVKNLVSQWRTLIPLGIFLHYSREVSGEYTSPFRIFDNFESDYSSSHGFMMVSNQCESNALNYVGGAQSDSASNVPNLFNSPDVLERKLRSLQDMSAKLSFLINFVHNCMNQKSPFPIETQQILVKISSLLTYLPSNPDTSGDGSRGSTDVLDSSQILQQLAELEISLNNSPK